MKINTLYIGSPSEPTQLRNSGAFLYDYAAKDGGFIKNNRDKFVQAIVVYYSSAEDKEFV